MTFSRSENIKDFKNLLFKKYLLVIIQNDWITKYTLYKDEKEVEQYYDNGGEKIPKTFVNSRTFETYKTFLMKQNLKKTDVRIEKYRGKKLQWVRM